MNVTGLPWFEKAIQTKGFAVGEYQVSRITDKPVLVFGYPVGKDSAKAISVLFIAVGIDRINQLAAGVQLPKDAAIAIIDRKGTVLARHPHPERWVGLSLPETPLIKTILTKGKGTAEVSGLDGIPRLYAFTALNNVPEGDIYLFQSLKGIQAIAAPTH